MTENLDINTKFYSYSGILGRRDYCLNTIYISAISLIVGSPFVIYWLIKCSSLEDLFRYNVIFWNAPIALKLFSFISAAALLALLIPTIHRRVKDLCEKTNNYLTVLSAVVFGLSNIWFVFPLKQYMAILCLSWIVGLCLLFIPGKVTSKLPYDYTKDFNWGAYFGTWIWGIYNKSYITLFMWAIGSTPFRELFKIYCGLKGNEWAYKGKEWNNIELFNKSQKRQTIFFICLNFLIIPALFILPIALIIVLAIAFGSGSCQNCSTVDTVAPPPAIEQKAEQKKTDKKVELSGVYKTMAYIYFDSYEFSENEYRFYVSEKDWKSYTIMDKMDLMNKAQKISKRYRYQLNRIKNTEGCPYSSDPDDLKKIKLYSTEKHQLLGEYNDDIDYDKISTKELFKSIFKMWKFYEIK